MSTRDYSDDTARVIDEEVEKILRDCEQRCVDTLTRERAGLEMVARALLELETISGEDVTRYIAMSRGEAVPPAPVAPPAPPAPASYPPPPAPAPSRIPSLGAIKPPFAPPPDFTGA